MVSMALRDPLINPLDFRSTMFIKVKSLLSIVFPSSVLIVACTFLGMGSGFCVAGQVETGMVSVGHKVLVMPGNEIAIVKGESSHSNEHLFFN